MSEPGDGARMGWRAAQTRESIIEAARRLFLDRGYAGTRINNITDACGISRAGFYTYFRDKREIFNLLGETSYHEVLKVVREWEALPDPCSHADIAGWVRNYFAFMDEYGAFIFSSMQSAPTDDEFRRDAQRTQMRVAWLLGSNIRARQRAPYEAPDALGLTTIGMLDRSWLYSHGMKLPVDDVDVVDTAARMILDILDNSEPTATGEG